MKNDELQNAPKIFCENIRVGFTPEFFVFSLSSGDESTVYSLTPGHAKRLMQYLTHEISQYEQAHGKINTTWEPKIVSPVQKLNPPLEQS